MYSSLKSVFEAAIPGISWVAFEVWRMSADDFIAAAALIDGCDIVVSQPLQTGHYGPLAAQALKDRRGAAQRLIFIHNLYFDGVVPDCSYVGRMGNRVTSPMGSYHSRIVLNAYLAGKSPVECRADLMSGHGIDPVLCWEQSVQLLRTREEAVDVPFVEDLEAQVRADDSFHMFNHPAASLILSYGQRILGAIFGSDAPAVPAVMQDELIKYGRWPVWGWVAKARKLPYRREGFLYPGQSGMQETSPDQFIDASYEIYSRTRRDNLVS